MVCSSIIHTICTTTQTFTHKHEPCFTFSTYRPQGGHDAGLFQSSVFAFNCVCYCQRHRWRSVVSIENCSFKMPIEASDVLPPGVGVQYRWCVVTVGAQTENRSICRYDTVATLPRCSTWTRRNTMNHRRADPAHMSLRCRRLCSRSTFEWTTS